MRRRMEGYCANTHQLGGLCYVLCPLNCGKFNPGFNADLSSGSMRYQFRFTEQNLGGLPLIFFTQLINFNRGLLKGLSDVVECRNVFCDTFSRLYR